MFLVPRMFIGTSFREVKPHVAKAIQAWRSGASLADACGPSLDIADTDLLVSLTLRPRTRHERPVAYGSAFHDVAAEIASLQGTLHTDDAVERWFAEAASVPWARWFALHALSGAIQRHPRLVPPLFDMLASHVEADDAALGRRLCIAVVYGCEPNPTMLHEYGSIRGLAEQMSFRQRSWSGAAGVASDLRDVAEKVRFRLEHGPPFPG